MENEITQITNAAELIRWEEVYCTQIKVSDEAQLILNYMETHNCTICTDQEGNLYLRDTAEENGEVMEFSMDEIVELVCNWNLEQIYDEQEKIKNGEEIDPEYYKTLQSDEERLDVLFERTDQCKAIYKWAAEITEKIMTAIQDKASEKGDMSQFIEEKAAEIAEMIKGGGR